MSEPNPAAHADAAAERATRAPGRATAEVTA